MIPVYAFLEGDSLGLLVFAYEDETVADLTRKVCASSRCRINVKDPGRLCARFGGEALEPGMKIRDTGISALSMIEIRKNKPECSDAA